MKDELITDYFGNPIAKVSMDASGKKTVTSFTGVPLGSSDKNGTRTFTGIPLSNQDQPGLLFPEEE